MDPGFDSVDGLSLLEACGDAARHELYESILVAPRLEALLHGDANVRHAGGLARNSEPAIWQRAYVWSFSSSEWFENLGPTQDGLHANDLAEGVVFEVGSARAREGCERIGSGWLPGCGGKLVAAVGWTGNCEDCGGGATQAGSLLLDVF